MPEQSKDRRKRLDEVEEIKYEENEEEKMNIEKKIKKLKEKLKTCQKEKEQYLSGWQRERADFINYKKDEDNRLKGVGIFQKGKIILEFLTILDCLEKAEEEFRKNSGGNIFQELADSPKLKPLTEWINGILEIKNQIRQILKREDVEEIDTKAKFNPDLHEVVETVDGDNDKIVEVVQKGYLLKGKLLRPAMVKVGKKVEKNKFNK